MIEARDVLERVRDLEPFNPYVQFNLGAVYWRLRLPDAAIRCYRQTLAAKPDFFPAVVNLGDALIELGEYREALRYTSMATRMQPGNSGVWRNQSRALGVLEELDAALSAAERAVCLAPKDIDAHRILIGCLTRLKRIDQAAARAVNLLALDPGDGIALLAMVIQDLRVGDWSQVEDRIRRLAEPASRGAIDQSVLGLAYTLDDPQSIFSCAKALDRQTLAVKGQRPQLTAHDGPLRIGYLSPDFREHPVAYMLADVFKHHDRKQVKVVAIPLRAPDGSPISDRLLATADASLDLSRLNDRQSAESIRQAGIDILVDLAGETDGCRCGILNWHPAPLQVLWLGCPITTGRSCYDGFIVDSFAVPDGMDGCFSEPLVRIPGCFHPIATGLAGPPPALTRADLGLPDAGLILAALHQIGKITPATFRRWCRIAASAPDAILLLADHRPQARASMCAVAETEGLDPRRLHFASFERDRARHIARWRCVDLVLDGFPYGGHSTVGEALSQGVPVLSCAGASLHARVGASMLHSLGLGGLVADSADQFQTMGIGLVRDRDALAGWRRKAEMAANAIRAETMSRQLEAVYRQLVADSWRQ